MSEMIPVNVNNAEDVAKKVAALLRPFDPRAVKWKPSMVKSNRALAMCYIDARLVMDRLDKVMKPQNWRTEYVHVGDGSVECRLTLRLGGEWITKADVGSPSEQPDGGDRTKAAYSDALKRAAVHWGIGRYLYRLPSQWVDYDPVKKQITSPPRLPAWAIPDKADDDEAEEPAVPEPPQAAAQPLRQDEPAPPKLAPDALPRLVQGYATAKNADDFKVLEDRRRVMWPGLTTDQQKQLKDTAEVTRTRLQLQPAGAK